LAKFENGQPVPTAAAYAKALKSIGISDNYKKFLLVHYQAPDFLCTVDHIAKKVGYKSYNGANRHYAQLATLVNRALGKRNDEFKVETLVIFYYQGKRVLWVLRPQVARALEVLGWVNAKQRTLKEIAIPEEVPDSGPIFEGAKKQITVNAYERSPVARQKCIDHYGHTCYVCSFDFGKVYGEKMIGRIVVHHEVPLETIGKEYQVDPVKDLKPLCYNCHAAIHAKKPAYTISQLRTMLKKVR
jgi:5-methylcytosine-specific restriction enzyme A